MRARLGLDFLFGLFGAAIVLWLFAVPRETEVTHTVCRPSAPERAVATDTNVVLYLGNSLVFDHDWRVDGTRTVNCARQGMTASELRPELLPAISPSLVVFGFGTVEAVRAAPDPVNIGAFINAFENGVSKTEDRFPDATLAILSVPPLKGIPQDDLNEALQDLADRSDAAFLTNPAAKAYDGVHLLPESYRNWQSEIAKIIRDLSVR